MALPSSGTIRMSQINTELGRSSTAQISLDTAENGGYGAINTNSTSRPNSANPAAMSEWYSYNHSAVGATCPAPTINNVTRCSTYAILDISYSTCTNLEVEYSSNGGASWTTEGNTGCVTTKYVYNLSPSTTYLFRARVWCAATGTWSNKSNVANTTTCSANGTYISQFCSGGALYYTYADGCCGTYNTLINSCDSSCGCSATPCTVETWYLQPDYNTACCNPTYSNPYTISYQGTISPLNASPTIYLGSNCGSGMALNPPEEYYYITGNSGYPIVYVLRSGGVDSLIVCGTCQGEEKDE